ncbi:aspartate dehydrogenase domain-containing protein [Rhizobium metallidurans]|uniref:L-aspartate dehydrogenase n=1 Tax=Rhizobium metallidurans TaxID=1265931 RepID=A0A7W6CV66_9HYPH|nr:aspartate dehydrogenase domain-containing protein [Rhizobium metallidurans]MBB3966779.1 aspartate dehydrogenase [Rhizobium metallidurans]
MASIEPVTVGLIGFGALAKQVMAAFETSAVRWVVLLREGSSASPPAPTAIVKSVGEMLAAHPRVVIEAAGQRSVAAYVPQLLRAGVPVVIASIGALAEPETAQAVGEARAASGARLVIPSGAIGGLDYLAAVSILPDTTINYRLKKPVAAWRAELDALGLTDVVGPVTLFEGSPSEAAKLYPKNTNAAFTAALIAHPTAISVAVVADPGLTSNIHEIEVRSSAGEALFRFANAPAPDNPKTSVVTGLSLAAAARDLLESKGRP